MQRTVRIDDDIWPWLEAQIKLKRFHNLSHAVNYSLSELKRLDDENKIKGISNNKKSAS